DHDEYRHKRQVIAESCREIGRDPSTIRYSVMANYIVGRDSEELKQRAVQLAEVLPRLKRDSPDEILDVARKRAFVGTPAEVFEPGYVGITWPKEYGGRGAGFMEQLIFNDEMILAKAPDPINVIGLGMGGPVVIAHGTEEQKKRYLSPLLSADEIWCQGFSEP